MAPPFAFVKVPLDGILSFWHQAILSAWCHWQTCRGCTWAHHWHHWWRYSLTSLMKILKNSSLKTDPWGHRLSPVSTWTLRHSPQSPLSPCFHSSIDAAQDTAGLLSCENTASSCPAFSPSESQVLLLWVALSELLSYSGVATDLAHGLDEFHYVIGNNFSNLSKLLWMSSLLSIISTAPLRLVLSSILPRVLEYNRSTSFKVILSLGRKYIRG